MINDEFSQLRNQLEQIMFLKNLNPENNYEPKLTQVRNNLKKNIRERIELNNDKNKRK